MAEPEPKKLKTEDDDVQFFKKFLLEKDDKTITMLRCALLNFGSGYGQLNLAFIRVTASNANSSVRFDKATIDTQLHEVNSDTVLAPLRLFYMRGYCTLRDFLDVSDPKIPKNLAERRALKHLLQFLANDANRNWISLDHRFYNRSCESAGTIQDVYDGELYQQLFYRQVIVGNRGNSESEAALALRLAQHLLIPLVGHKAFVIDSYPGLQFTTCCVEEHPLNGEKGDTSFGCPKGWHGRADILLMDDEVPLTVLHDATTTSDASSVLSDSPIDVKKDENFSADCISQVLAQTIVFSFLHQKKKPLAPFSVMPGIGICSGKLIVYLYDCVEDILLTTGMVNLFAQCPGSLDYGAVIILWLVLNHSLFGNKIPEKYKCYSAFFHHVLGPVQLEVYKNESQQPCSARFQRNDIIQSLDTVRYCADWENDATVFTEEMKNQFPEREAVSLNDLV